MSDLPERPLEPEINSVGAASVTDCTGFIPALPQDEAELKSYSEISAPIDDENDFSVRKHNKK